MWMKSSEQSIEEYENKHIFIPPANCVSGGVYCFHVRPSVCPSVRNIDTLNICVKKLDAKILIFDNMIAL